MPVAQPRLVEPVHEVARPLGDRAQQKHHVGAGHLLFEFHEPQVTGVETGSIPPTAVRFTGLAPVTADPVAYSTRGRCPDCVREVWGGAGPRVRLLRQVRSADAAGTAVGARGDPGGGGVLPARRPARGCVHLDLRGAALVD